MEKSLVVWELFSDLGAREQIWSRGQKPILARVVNKFVVRLSLSLSLWTAPCPALPHFPRFGFLESKPPPPTLFNSHEFPKQKVESLNLNQGDFMQS